jgi:hypothetical protein
MTTQSSFNVRDYGAIGVAQEASRLTLQNFRHKWISYPPGTSAVIFDAKPGATYDSVGIQRAIDAAHAAGGGTVVVPSGNYLVAPIQLRSRVRLHLEAGASLYASPHLPDYRQPSSVIPAYPGDRGIGHFASMRAAGTRATIWADDAEDIALTGMGKIDGQSPQWVIPWMNSNPTNWESLQNARGTTPVSFHRCRRVRVEGIRILQSPTWTLVFDTCDTVQVRGVEIRDFEAINADGIDLVSTSNVTISDCHVWATDDAICLKNFSAGQTMGNITVTNCVLRTLCNGLKIGTETLGNFQDITFSNIVVCNPEGDVKGAEGGINLNAVDGGFVRNVNISNIVLRNVDCPIFLLSGCRRAKQEKFHPTIPPRAGRMERIYISNVQADGARHTSWIVGDPDAPIRDLHLSNLNIRKTRDFYDAPVTTPVPHLPEAYPSPCRFGRRHAGDDLPAFGLYLRDVQRISVRDFQLDSTKPDRRQFISQDNCSDVTLQNCRTNIK